MNPSAVTELSADCDGQVAHTQHLNGAELIWTYLIQNWGKFYVQNYYEKKSEYVKRY